MLRLFMGTMDEPDITSKLLVLLRSILVWICSTLEHFLDYSIRFPSTLVFHHHIWPMDFYSTHLLLNSITMRLDFMSSNK
jgi:hypothetical protein